MAAIRYPISKALSKPSVRSSAVKVNSKVNKKALFAFFGVVLLLLGVMGYQLLSLFWYEPLDEKEVEVLVEKYTSTEEVIEQEAILFPEGENRLIIPKIGLDIGILSGGEDVLEKALWHRFPERGDPLNGGNLILSGHRFNVGFDGFGFRRTSPLFNIEKLSVGDTIEVIWEKTSYTYEINEIKTVAPNSLEIENPSDAPILTLYSCTLNGSNDGRVVLIAVPVN